MADPVDPLTEAATLLQECGLVPREDLARVRVTGADRVDYLHRMLTQDIAGLPAGAATCGGCTSAARTSNARVNSASPARIAIASPNTM